MKKSHRNTDTDTQCLFVEPMQSERCLIRIDKTTTKNDRISASIVKQINFWAI